MAGWWLSIAIGDAAIAGGAEVVARLVAIAEEVYDTIMLTMQEGSADRSSHRGHL